MRLRDEAHVVTAPGFAPGPEDRGYLRFSFAARPERVVEGVKRMSKLWCGR